MRWTVKTVSQKFKTKCLFLFFLAGVNVLFAKQTNVVQNTEQSEHRNTTYLILCVWELGERFLSNTLHSVRSVNVNIET